jgi:hypothetical protein
MSTIKILTSFKTHLLAFCDELIEQFPEEGDFVVLKIFIDGRVPIKTAIEVFNSNINNDNKKLRGMITSRNDNFFMNENPFTFMSSDKISRLSKIWMADNMDDDDREVIWKWIDAFVKIGDKYAEIMS